MSDEIKERIKTLELIIDKKQKELVAIKQAVPQREAELHQLIGRVSELKELQSNEVKPKTTKRGK